MFDASIPFLLSFAGARQNSVHSKNSTTVKKDRNENVFLTAWLTLHAQTAKNNRKRRFLQNVDSHSNRKKLKQRPFIFTLNKPLREIIIHLSCVLLR